MGLSSPRISKLVLGGVEGDHRHEEPRNYSRENMAARQVLDPLVCL